MNARRNHIPEFASVKHSVGYAVDQLVNSGNAMTTVTYTSLNTLEKLEREVEARTTSPLTKLMLRNHGQNDNWINAQRMTFFGSQHAETIAQRVAAKMLGAHLWVPELQKFGDFVGEGVRASGRKEGVSTLEDWAPNRYGINVLCGQPGLPALVAPHTDVDTEHGLVLALELHGRQVEGNLSFIFGRDTCDLLGLEQSVHQVESETRRLSVTVADLHPVI